MKQLGSVLALGIALALSSCDRAPETPSKDAEAAVPTPVDTTPAAPAAPLRVTFSVTRPSASYSISSVSAPCVRLTSRCRLSRAYSASR